MLKLLIKLFIKNGNQVNDPAVRRAYGTLCSVYGIFLNLLLFAGKYFAGLISGSVAIIADAFNNLSDAGSSVITLLGFAISGKKPDLDHPYGHGRAEYLAGLALSALIMLMGFELIKSSVDKLLHPSDIEAGLLPALILLASILVKLYMGLYNRAVGRKISSAAMEATATDSLSDCIATAVVLISMGLSYFFRLNIDAYVGFLVAALIIWAGLKSAKETISPLLGQAPDPELIKQIEDLALSYPEILGIHDLIIHDYGPGRGFVSLHAEVDGKGEIFSLHDAMDRAEKDIRERFGILATIHLDPIQTDDPVINRLRQEISELISERYPGISIHDFRIVPGCTHTNVIFDALVPTEFAMSNEEIKAELQNLVSSNFEKHFAVIEIDRGYI